MACHEVAALRLGLMQVLGKRDEAERQHELAELGEGASQPGPIKSLCEAKDLGSLKKFFEAALADLHTEVARTPDGDAKLPYLRTRMVYTKKVEMDVHNLVHQVEALYQDLDEMHDFMHEVHPG